ncbi:MAG: four helix bundle protein [Patescibacteria group bacterium]
MPIGLENLEIYQLAKNLEIEVYKITQGFPKDEKYRSVDQLRRSSSAVANNIAEAYSKRSIKNKTHILRNIAIAEAEETKGNLSCCWEKGFVKKEEIAIIVEQYTVLMKRIYGYIKYLSKTDN